MEGMSHWSLPVRLGVYHASCRICGKSKLCYTVAECGPGSTFYRRTLKPSSCRIHVIKVYSTKMQSAQDKIAKEWSNIYSHYEEFVGLAEVLKAQEEVKKAEKRFLNARYEERSLMREILSVRDELRHVRERLSHVDYSNPLYPQLANEQHELVTAESKLQNAIEEVEENERDAFLKLSASMRDSYEKERARVERTKNWSLIGTVIGTIIGMLGSIYINRVRTKDLKQAILSQDQNDEMDIFIKNIIPYTQEQYTDIKDEIRKLQACLINKLIEVPPDTKPSLTNVESNSTTQEPLPKAMRRLQHELNGLIERTKQNQTELMSQTDNLLKEMGSLKNSKQVDTEVFEKMLKLKLKKVAVPASVTNNSRLAKNLTGISTDESESSEKSSWKNIALWGAVFSALYYIITV